MVPLKLMLSGKTNEALATEFVSVCMPVKLVNTPLMLPALDPVMFQVVPLAELNELLPPLPASVPMVPLAPILKVSLPAPPLMVLIPLKFIVTLLARTVPLLLPEIVAAIGCELVYAL